MVIQAKIMWTLQGIEREYLVFSVVRQRVPSDSSPACAANQKIDSRNAAQEEKGIAWSCEGKDRSGKEWTGREGRRQCWGWTEERRKWKSGGRQCFADFEIRMIMIVEDDQCKAILSVRFLRNISFKSSTPTSKLAFFMRKEISEFGKCLDCSPFCYPFSLWFLFCRCLSKLSSWFANSNWKIWNLMFQKDEKKVFSIFGKRAKPTKPESDESAEAAAEDTQPRPWKLICWNVAGLRAAVKVGDWVITAVTAVHEWLQKSDFSEILKEDPDVILLEETKCKEWPDEAIKAFKVLVSYHLSSAIENFQCKMFCANNFSQK